MNHFTTSILKSILRIAGLITTIFLAAFDLIKPSIITAASALALAEILGIAEEFLDKRKENTWKLQKKHCLMLKKNT